MIAHDLFEIGLALGVLLLLAVPLGAWMAHVYEAPALWGEGWLYAAAGVRTDEDMDWKRYTASVLLFNLLGTLVVYAIQRAQAWLPLNPAALGAVTPEVAFNTATSFATNTNWQAYGGETTLSYFTQMVALTVQNFVSAATGMAVLVALVRGFVRRQANGLGSFWVDLTRSVLYVLLPLSVLLALALVSQGVVQTFGGAATAHTLVGADQVIAVGPAASQIAIKQLGTNGGGFFNVNSAHPFENPTALSNFLELQAILLISAALCFTFGKLVRDVRQGRALLGAMLLLLVPLLLVCTAAEQAGNPILSHLGADQAWSVLQPGGNMEGKEARFGIAASTIWAAYTTAASNGSVNAMLDSFTPLGGFVPMWLIQFGEVVFGGVGSGLYGMLVFAVVAVFLAGLMVGRTPEYLGKKIESYEVKMCFSEILDAYASSSNNNGSAFGGITVSGLFYATTQGLTMLIGRYWIIVPVLAMAGSLAKKKYVPPSTGTLPTHTPLFVVLLSATVVLVGALTYVPALCLGPIVEHLQLYGGG
jgi:K+-transporting ATPase ATPase A chain